MIQPTEFGGHIALNDNEAGTVLWMLRCAAELVNTAAFSGTNLSGAKL